MTAWAVNSFSESIVLHFTVGPLCIVPIYGYFFLISR